MIIFIIMYFLTLLSLAHAADDGCIARHGAHPPTHKEKQYAIIFGKDGIELVRTVKRKPGDEAFDAEKQKRPEAGTTTHLVYMRKTIYLKSYQLAGSPSPPSRFVACICKHACSSILAALFLFHEPREKLCILG